MKRMHIETGPIDVESLRQALTNPSCGAHCAFEGRVRDHHDGQVVLGLAYEAYVPLAESEGERIIEEARSRFDIVDARCSHRIGAVAIGDVAIWVGVAAAHRDAAFAACRFIVDEAKRRLPIWKKEHYRSGESAWLMPVESRSDAR
jgi:molybdopterin synthase catalytic subunit